MVSRKTRLLEVQSDAASCTNCPLYKDATQTVFGNGRATAPLMLVGEQPGDEEDKQGEPFVGPAGRLLRKALGEAEIDIDQTYLTNVVKHFKWKPGPGWRRLHQKPNRYEVEACRPWLELELAIVRPKLIVGLGATACQAFFGPKFKVTASRGQIHSWQDHEVLVTVHPSSVLRSSEARAANYAAFVGDLIKVRRRLAGRV